MCERGTKCPQPMQPVASARAGPEEYEASRHLESELAIGEVKPFVSTGRSRLDWHRGWDVVYRVKVWRPI
jgi:hypothetical protein